MRRLTEIFAGLAAILAMACGSSGKPAGDSSAAGDSNGGETVTSGGTAAMTGAGGGNGGHGSGAGGDDCEKLAACCERVTQESATCRKTAAQHSASICGLALSRYAAECPELAFPDDYGTTSDGWKYYAAWSDQRLNGFAQRQGELVSMFLGHDGTLFGSGSSGFSRSADNGATWTRLANERVSVELPSGELLGVHDGAIVRSRDGGASFTSLGEATPFVKAIVAHGSALYRLTDHFIEKSDDAGMSFVPVAETPSECSGLFVDHYGSLFAWGDNAIFHQRAGDHRWSFQRIESRFTDALELPDGTLLLAGTGGVCRSLDHGDTWQLNDQVRSATKLLVTSKGVVVAVANGGAYRSQDAGKTFENIGPKVKGAAVSLESAVALPDDSILGASGAIAKMYLSQPITEAPSGSDSPTQPPERCFDGKQNAAELGVDCGGDCGQCLAFEFVPSWLSPDYIASDGSFYRADSVNDQLTRSTLGHDPTTLGQAREIIAEAKGALFAIDRDVPSLFVSFDRGEHFEPYGPSPLPDDVGAFMASAAQSKTYLAIGTAVYVLPLTGGTAEPVATPDGVSFYYFHEASDGTVYALAWNRPQNVYRANADGSVWSLLGDKEFYALADDAGTLYGKASDGIYRLDGASFNLLPGTESVTWNEIVINSHGTLAFTTDQGLVSYPLHGPNAGKSSILLPGKLDTGPTAVTGDRVYVRPYLSAPAQ